MPLESWTGEKAEAFAKTIYTAAKGPLPPSGKQGLERRVLSACWAGTGPGQCPPTHTPHPAGPSGLGGTCPGRPGARFPGDLPASAGDRHTEAGAVLVWLAWWSRQSLGELALPSQPPWPQLRSVPVARVCSADGGPGPRPAWLPGQRERVMLLFWATRRQDGKGQCCPPLCPLSFPSHPPCCPKLNRRLCAGCFPGKRELSELGHLHLLQKAGCGTSTRDQLEPVLQTRKRGPERVSKLRSVTQLRA